MVMNALSTSVLLSLLPFLVLLLASPSPAPNPYPAVVSLPSRPPRTAQVPQIPQAVQPQSVEVEHDLLPFVLISTIDGALHAVNRDGGEIKWSLRDGVSPLVAGGVKGKGLEEYIVEPLSGDLYVFEDEAEGQSRVRKLPLSVEQL